jgi:dimethylargininase
VTERPLPDPLTEEQITAANYADAKTAVVEEIIARARAGAGTATSGRRFGAQGMVSPLREAIVKRPGPAFAGAFDDPANGFLHPVDIDEARRQHDALCQILGDLGVTVHELDAETTGPDLVYTFDAALVTERGAILLRPGKPTRRDEPQALAEWFAAHEIPIVASIESPGTVEGGDTLWLRPGLFCIGRSLRTNGAGAEQLAAIVGGDVRIFDVPYANGPGECLHLLSLISPVDEQAAVVHLPMLPAGMYELLRDLDFDLIPVPPEEMPTLGCNVLAVRPGVVIIAQGNPTTQRALEARGFEVHTFPATEIGVNGGGGPTCLTRPILRG